MRISMKLVALLLVILMCVPVFAACVNDEEGESRDTVDTGVDTSSMSDIDKRKREPDNLPDWVSTKYQGRTLTTYTFHENYELDVNGYDEYTGSKVHDLIYTRNCIVEGRLGITLDNIKSSAGHHSDSQ